MYSVDLRMVGSVGVEDINTSDLCRAVITTHDSLPILQPVKSLIEAKDRLIQYNYQEMVTSLPIIEILHAATGDVCLLISIAGNTVTSQLRIITINLINLPCLLTCISHAQKVTAPNNSTPYTRARKLR